MKRLFKTLKLRQLLVFLLAIVILGLNTACNRGDFRGARPENPPVQLGGQNNPHKTGGDENTQYKSYSPPNPEAKIK